VAHRLEWPPHIRDKAKSEALAKQLKVRERMIKLYQNRSIETAEVITNLIELAKEMRGAHKRGEKLNLTEDELSFYDALEVNDSAVKVLGDKTLLTIARELVDAIPKNVTIDRAVKESALAKMRVSVRRLLRKYDYPPGIPSVSGDTFGVSSLFRRIVPSVSVHFSDEK
jgi:type I restriction enzyme R subunit